jgi:hypothetical protein
MKHHWASREATLTLPQFGNYRTTVPCRCRWWRRVVFLICGN